MMAKKEDPTSSLFAKTEKQKEPGAEPKTPGIYFSAEEVERLNKVMQDLGEDSFYKVVKLAVTYFLNKYEAGEIEAETKTKKELKLD